MIEPTEQMHRVYAEAWWRTAGLDEEQVAAAAGGEVTVLNQFRDAGLRALLAHLELDYCLKQKGHARNPLVHLATAGDGHVHCCGTAVTDLPRGDRWTLDPHGYTCREPT